jgi:hypothetical protein
MDKQVCGQPVIVPLLGGTAEEKPAAYQEASPIDHLPLGMRTVLVKGALGFSLAANLFAAQPPAGSTE